MKPTKAQLKDLYYRGQGAGLLIFNQKPGLVAYAQVYFDRNGDLRNCKDGDIINEKSINLEYIDNN